MSEAVALERFVHKASDLLEACQRLEQDGAVPPNAPWKADFERVKTLAARVKEKAGSPVKIGVVGEFSAGKTLLLGSLIGYADGLPVSELPTTGNITALRFTPVNELRTTEVGPYTLYYLDQEGVEECLAFMLKEARERGRIAQLSADLLDRLEVLRGADLGEALGQLEDWCRSAWGTTNNPNLRYLIRELLAFTRAYSRCSGLCQNPQPIEIDAAKARRGLELAEPPRDIQGLSFNDLAPPPPALSTAPAFLTTEQIRDTFPLIRKLVVDVKVSRQIWNFSALGEAGNFVLLDFPGLGAANSGVRDLHLCLRELQEVQTILILLNGDRPGGNEGAAIYDLMQKNRPGQEVRDMILVGVGRFDRLPLGNEGEQALKQLAGRPGAASTAKATASVFQDEDEVAAPAVAVGGLAEKDVLERLPILNTCIAGAEALVPQGRKDRIVLVSPLLHLKYLEEHNPGLSVGTDKFLLHMRADVEKAMALRGTWQAVADRLAEGGGKDVRLTRWLADFAADGGIGRVRDLIQSHVQKHGLAQLLRDVRKIVEALQAAQRDLLARLPEVVEGHDARTPEDRLEDVEKRFGKLAAFYQEQFNRLERSAALQVPRDGQPVPLNEVLRDEVVFRVREWDEWDALFQHSKDGYIVEPQGGGVFGKSMFQDDQEDEDGPASVFPTRSDDLYPAFEQTTERLQQFCRDLLLEGLNAYLDGLQSDLADERAELKPILDNPNLPRQVKALRLGARGQGLVPALRAAVEPVRIQAVVFPEGDAGKYQISMPLNAATLFPLARTRGDVAGRVFGWARKFQEVPEDMRPERHHAHQAQALRVCVDLIETLAQELNQYLGVGLQEVMGKVKEALREVGSRLSLVAGNRFVLDALLTPAAATAGAPAAVDPLIPVRRVAAEAW